MKKIMLEVIGSEPPCKKCKQVEENAKSAADAMKSQGIAVEVVKLNSVSKAVLEKYGSLITPAVTLNGIIKFMGRVPSQEELLNLLKNTQ